MLSRRFKLQPGVPAKHSRTVTLISNTKVKQDQLVAAPPFDPRQSSRPMVDQDPCCRLTAQKRPVVSAPPPRIAKAQSDNRGRTSQTFASQKSQFGARASRRGRPQKIKNDRAVIEMVLTKGPDLPPPRKPAPIRPPTTKLFASLDARTIRSNGAGAQILRHFPRQAQKDVKPRTPTRPGPQSQVKTKPTATLATSPVWTWHTRKIVAPVERPTRDLLPQYGCRPRRLAGPLSGNPLTHFPKSQQGSAETKMLVCGQTTKESNTNVDESDR